MQSICDRVVCFHAPWNNFFFCMVHFAPPPRSGVNVAAGVENKQVIPTAPRGSNGSRGRRSGVSLAHYSAHASSRPRRFFFSSFFCFFSVRKVFAHRHAYIHPVDDYGALDDFVRAPLRRIAARRDISFFSVN